MKEIRLNKIGFNILADTDNVCYALLLKDWQLQQKKGWQPESVWEYIVGDLDSEHRGGTAHRQTNKKQNITLLFIAAEYGPRNSPGKIS